VEKVREQLALVAPRTALVELDYLDGHKLFTSGERRRTQ
jgi:hypothetical protein